MALSDLSIPSKCALLIAGMTVVVRGRLRHLVYANE